MNFIPVSELIYRCSFTHIVYCAVGGHYLIRLDVNDCVCPMGCNT